MDIIVFLNSPHPAGGVYMAIWRGEISLYHHMIPKFIFLFSYVSKKITITNLESLIL